MKIKQKIKCIVIISLLMGAGLAYWFFLETPQQITPSKPIDAPAKNKLIQLHRESFKNLPGWLTAHNHKKSLRAFQASCRTFIRQNPENNVGSEILKLKIKDWQPACQAALKLSTGTLTDDTAKKFFEHWFLPFTLYDKATDKKEALHGLFTGYYMPFLHGSLVKTSEYTIPIYGVPDDLITVDLGQFNSIWENKRIVGRIKNNKLIPYYTRADIDQGAIKDHAPVIAWTNNAFDRLNLEIQGSGVLQLPNGEKMYLGYASGNGAAYTAIGKVLIDKGVLTYETTSMQTIREYLESHPKKINAIIHHNKSFVFFRVLDRKVALGAQGVGLTSGYSLAVDRQWIPLGVPLWLSTTHPDQTQQNQIMLQRLMIAQDTGGAIRGIVRGDVYWGASKRAEIIAGKMKSKGQYWLLIPNHFAHNKISKNHS